MTAVLVGVVDDAAAIELTGRSMETTNHRRRKPHNGGIRFAAGSACDCAAARPAAESGGTVPMTTNGTIAPMHGRHCHPRTVTDGHFHRRNGSSCRLVVCSKEFLCRTRNEHGMCVLAEDARECTGKEGRARGFVAPMTRTGPLEPVGVPFAG